MLPSELISEQVKDRASGSDYKERGVSTLLLLKGLLAFLPVLRFYLCFRASVPLDAMVYTVFIRVSLNAVTNMHQHVGGSTQ